jgi:uncharacterized membrane protein
LKPESKLESHIARWVAAGVIDSAAADRIRAFEAGDENRATLRWPVVLALGIGGLLVGAGITLFVAAHWDELSAAQRFSLVLVLVAMFHVGGALVAEKFSALSTTLHAIGTIALGAGIFLSGQIFNLQENWATGILLWAVGAAVGYFLLRQWPQAAFVALLIPAWLVGQWDLSVGLRRSSELPIAVGLISLALAYLSARAGDGASPERKAIAWIGGMAFLPVTIIGVWAAIDSSYSSYYGNGQVISPAALTIAWLIAIVAPLVLAWFLRRAEVWTNVIAAAWSCLVIFAARNTRTQVGGYRSDSDFGMVLILYFLCGSGAVGLIAWGLRDRRKERVNLGVAGFALTVLFFYFDCFMDKLDRSASLLILGVLCLAGGYALERTRRRLVARMEASS